MYKIFNKLKISIFFLFFSLSFLIYVIYKSEFFWEGIQREFYNKYYLISIIFIIFSSFTFYFKKSINQKILLIFFSVYMALFFLELYLSISLNQNSPSKILELKKGMYKSNTSKEYDTRNQVEIYEELKKVEKISIKLSPKDFLKNENNLIPLSGISNIKTIDCNENGYFSFYKSDRYGFNNNDYIWDKEIIDYVLIGDSFTQGACVNPEKNIAGNLSAISSKNVLNLGFAGNGPLLELATLKEYIEQVKVKKILWFYFEGNDNFDLSYEIKNKKLIKYLNEKNFDQKLYLKQKDIDKFINNEILKKVKFNRKREVSSEKKENFIFKLFKLFHLRDQIRKYLNENYSFKKKEFKKIMIQAKKITEENSAKIYFIYLPEYPRYKKLFYNNDNLKKIEEIIDEIGLTFINIDELVFKKNKNPLSLFPFKMHGHYNEKGYKIIANAIYSSLN